MGCGSWDAAARRRWAKVARIGYAIRQARRNRARVPHHEERSADTSDSLPVESKFQADAVGVDTAPAASKTSALPCVGRSLPPSRKQLEEWERRAAPALFDELTEDGNRSAVTAVRLRKWRLEERQRQAWRVARTLDVDPTIRYRCPAWWSIMVCDLITYLVHVRRFLAGVRRCAPPCMARRGLRLLRCSPLWPLGLAAARTARWIPVTRRPLSLSSAFVGPPACAGSGTQCAVVPYLCSVRRLRSSGARVSTWRRPARLGVWVAC